MSATVKIDNTTIYVVGEKPSTERKVVPLLRRITFLTFLTSSFFVAPKIADIGSAIYTDFKVPRAHTPLPQGDPVWIRNDEPMVWEEAAKDLDSQWDQRSDIFNPLIMLPLFSDLKMTDQQKLLVILNYKVASERYILGSDEIQLRSLLENRNARARQWLDNAWEKIQQQAMSGEVVELSINDIARDQLQHDKITLKSWQDDAAKEHHTIDKLIGREVASAYIDIGKTPKNVGIVDYQQAQDNLLQAVRDSGLAALVVPGVMSNSPKLMNMQAQNIQQANIDLRRATGLNGGVLGVHHRVILHNEYINSNGSMEPLDNGYLWIKSSWKTLGHEWFHAFDASQISAIKGRGYVNFVSTYLDRSSLSVYRDSYALHSKQKQLHDDIVATQFDAHTNTQFINEVAVRSAERTADGSVMVLALDKASQQALKDGAQKNAHNWSYYRQMAVGFAKDYPLQQWATSNRYIVTEQSQHQWEEEKERAVRYLQAPTENMAFLFQGHLAALYHKNDIKALSGELDGESGLYVPTIAESTQQMTYWNTYFSSLQQWWGDDAQERKTLPWPMLSKTNIVQNRSKQSSLHPLPPLPAATR